MVKLFMDILAPSAFPSRLNSPPRISLQGWQNASRKGRADLADPQYNQRLNDGEISGNRSYSWLSQQGCTTKLSLLSRESPQPVKFPDIGFVNRFYQKQTLNIFPIFLYKFIRMLELQPSLLAPLNLLHALKLSLISPAPPSHQLSPLDAELQNNRNIVKEILSAKKRIKNMLYHLEEQLQALKQLKFHTTQSLEDFCRTFSPLVSIFNPHITPITKSSTTSSDKLRNLLSLFIEKQQQTPETQSLRKIMANHISDSSPYTILHLSCLIIKRYIHTQIKLLTYAQINRHEEQKKKIILNRSNTRDKTLSLTLNLKSQPSLALLNNKQSVLAIILEDLQALYKSLPLQDLDPGFLKTMKKAPTIKSLLEKEESLQKAVEILIQTKNKTIKTQIDQYYLRYHKTIKKTNLQKKYSKMHSIKQTTQSEERIIKAKSKSPEKRLFQMQRIRSQNIEESPKNTKQPRNSLLLCPKKNQISFESSIQVSRKLQREKTKRQLLLPQISSNSRYLNNRSSITKDKITSSWIQPVNKSLKSSYERALLKSSHQVSPREYHFKQSITQDNNVRKINHFYQKTYEVKKQAQNPEAHIGRFNEGQLRDNRKLMLQLLREKNRNTDFQK